MVVLGKEVKVEQKHLELIVVARCSVSHLETAASAARRHNEPMSATIFSLAAKKLKDAIQEAVAREEVCS